MKKIMKIILMLFCIINTLGTNKNNSKDNNIAPQFSVNQIQEQHDGLYDPYIKSIYDSTRNVRGVALKDYYAPIYFRNLKNNIGNNLFGTCTFVAIGMLLSFWDTYWNDNIIPEQYESTSLWFNGTLGPDTDSPGIIKETGPVFEFNDLNTIDEKLARFKRLANNSYYTDRYFQIKLIRMWEDYINNTTFTDKSMTMNNLAGFLSNHFYYDLGYNRSDFSIVHCVDAYEDVRDFAIEYVTQGIPVLLEVERVHNSSIYKHMVIAYDYDEDKDEIYCNMGWGNNASHVVIDTYNYDSYKGALALNFYTPHVHSNGYRQPWSNDSYCACDYAKPFDIEISCEQSLMTDVDGDSLHKYNRSLIYKWHSLYNEKWFENLYPGIQYDFTIRINNETNNSYNFYTRVSDNKCVISGDRVNILQDCAEYDVQIDLVYSSYPRFCESGDRNHTLIKKINKFGYNCNHLITPSNYGINSSIRTSNNINVNLGTSTTTLNINYQNVAYNENNIILYASKNSDSFIEYNFNKPILRVDVEMSHWDFTDALSYYNYGSFHLDIKRNDVWITYEDLLDYNLSTDRNNKKWYSFEFDEYVESIRFYAVSDFGYEADDYIAAICFENVCFYNELPTSGSEIPFQPQYWNDINIVGYVNCYCYALNYQIDMFNSQNLRWINPGDYGCYRLFPITKENMVRNVTCDFEEYNSHFSMEYNKEFKFYEVGRFEKCPEGTYKVALVANDVDYHWYRQNPDGTWSHKDSTSCAVLVDDNNQTIIDPKICARNSYERFLGYFAITPWENGIYMLLNNN